MSWLRLNRADGLLLGILLVLAAITALLVWRFSPAEPRGGGLVDPPSTFHNSRGGTKAAFLVLEELGYQPMRFQQPMTERALRDVEALAVLQPPRWGGEGTSDRLAAWVRRGGRLVLIPREGQFTDWFDYSYVPGEDDEDDEEGSPAASDEPDGGGPGGEDPAAGDPEPGQGGDEPAAGDHETDSTDEADASDSDDEPGDASEPRTIRIAADRREGAPLLDGVRRIVSRRGVRFDPHGPLARAGPFAEAEFAPLWRDGGELAAFHVEHGEGRLIVLGDSYPLTNVALRKGDNAVLLANLASALAGADRSRAIAFDEYHMGYADLTPQGLAILRLLTWRGRGWGLAQAALAVLAGLLAGAVRFGQPRDVTVRQRRHEAEFVEAAGAMLDRAKATGPAGSALCAHYRRRLCRQTHLPEGAPEDALARAVHRQGGLDIRAALAHCASLGPGTRGDTQRVLRTAQTLYRATEALKHGAGRSR